MAKIKKDPKALIRALQSLPLLGDDLYLRTQAMNLGVVDHFLLDVELQLLQEYEQLERTPMASARRTCFSSTISPIHCPCLISLIVKIRLSP